MAAIGLKMVHCILSSKWIVYEPGCSQGSYDTGGDISRWTKLSSVMYFTMYGFSVTPKMLIEFIVARCHNKGEITKRLFKTMGTTVCFG